jgi:hypothetical protein
MKKTTLIALTALAAIALLVPAGSAMAQNTDTATATATATIVSPISIERVSNLAFSDIVVGASAGTVVVSPGGTRTVGTGLVGLNEGNVSAASFTVGGTPNRAFAIGLPGSITLSGSGGGSMTVDTFVSSLGTANNLGTTGSVTLNVGATLNVSASQTAGDYTGNFDVTVTYN